MDILIHNTQELNKIKQAYRKMETSFNSYNLGGKEFLNKNYSKAIEHYTNAMAENSWMNFSLAYLFRGLSYLHLKDYENAILDLIEAERVIKDDFKLYFHRAKAFKGLGRNIESYYDLLKAIELQPNSLNCHSDLAANCYVLERFDEAIDYYTKCISIADSKGMYYFNRGIVKKNSRNIQGYIEDIKLSSIYGFSQQASKEEFENPQYFK